MSAPTIDRTLVLHVAKLASLSLSDEEADRLAADLARIVEYVAQLEQVDVSGVAPMVSCAPDPRATAHVRLDRAPWRDDEPREGLSREDALSQAPRVEDEGFAVPAFVE